MNSIEKDNELGSNELRFLSFYLIVMTLEIAAEYYSGILGLAWALTLFRGLSLLPPLFALVFTLRYQLVPNTYRTSICIYFIFLLLWSILVYSIQNLDVSLFSAAIYFAIPLGVSLEHINPRELRNSFGIICIIGIICFLLVWFNYNIDFSKAVRRYYTWTDIFFWAGVFWAIIPIVLYAVIFDESAFFRYLAVAYWICGVLFNMIFVKRFIIVDSILLLLMSGAFFFFERKLTPRMILAGILLIGIGILIFVGAKNTVVGSLWDSVMGRFNETTINELDRFEESKFFFNHLNPIYILFGKGLWGAHIPVSSIKEAVHVGWSNLILKGGMILFLFALIPTIKAFMLLPKMKELDAKTKWAVCMACIYGVRLFYTNMHALYPEMMMTFFSYAIIMNYTTVTKPNKGSKYIR